MSASRRKPLLAIWLVSVLVALYIPIISVILASLTNTRYMQFPHSVWTLDAYRNALADYTTADLHATSLKIALVVVVLSVILATFGALAFARYDWKGRNLFRRLLLLPVFFPQPVLGLALLLTLTAAGITPELAKRGVRASRLDRPDRDARHLDPAGMAMT